VAATDTGTNLAELQQQLPNHKLKIKKPGQRSCNEKNEKGKLCGGHLKRWFYTADVKEQQQGDVVRVFGPDAEIYRCEFCKTLYLPNPEDPRGLNVAGQGTVSVFGLTLPPKTEPDKGAPAAGGDKDKAVKDAPPKA
jgi:hypothetical protein